MSNALQILAIIVYFAPFVMLPFAFKMAGGLMSTVFSIANDKNRGAFDRLRKVRQGQVEKRGGYYKQRYGDRIMQSRADAVRKLNASSSKYGRVRGGLMRAAGRQIAGLGGIENQMSAINARTGKAIQDEIATGADDRIRGLTVDRSMGFAAAQSQGLARTDGEGHRQWKSLGGKWVNESDVIEGQREWGRDVAAQQAALSYEMRKASSEEEAAGISKRYQSLARGQWGMTETQAGGAWIGAAFENQNSRLEYKYTSWKDGKLSRGKVTTASGEEEATALGAGLVSEIYDKRGSYNVAQMGSTTIEQLQEAYKDASLMAAGIDAKGNDAKYSAEQIAAATDQKQKIEAIAETFMHQYGGVGGESDDVARQIASQGGAQANSSRTANTPGSAHTAERVRQLAEMTGVYRAAPTGQYSAPQGRVGIDNPRPQA